MNQNLVREVSFGFTVFNVGIISELFHLHRTLLVAINKPLAEFWLEINLVVCVFWHRLAF